MFEHITKPVKVEDVRDAVIVQGVNCQGAYGAGFSGFIELSFPGVEFLYRRHVAQNAKSGNTDLDLLGTVQFIEMNTDDNSGLIDDGALVIANGFTQQFFGPGDKQYASKQAIESVLFKVVDYCEKVSISQVMMPKIGCGLAGLDWETQVKPSIEHVATIAAQKNIKILVVDQFY